MLIDRILYARLSTDTNITSLVGNRIVPTSGTLNTDISHLVYNVTTDPAESYLDGVCPIERHTLTVNAYALTTAEVDNILTAVKANLHGYRGGQVLWCTLTSYATVETEKGFLGQASYSIIQNNEVLSRSLQWQRNTDELVQLRNLTNIADGTLVSTATVNATIYEADETTVVHTFELFWTGTPGLFQNTVVAATTATMVNSTYRLKVVATTNISTATFWATIQMSN